MKNKFRITACFLFLPFLVAAQFTLKGKVSDKISNETLAGASISVEGTFIAVVSDPNGDYSILNLKNDSYTMQVSFLGYQPQKQVIKIEGDKELNIVLEPQAYLSDEVEVTATRASAGTPATFTNIDYAQIEKQNLGQDVPYLLQMTPSTVVTSDAGTGIGYTGVRIRGSDAERTNLTINGIPVNDAESLGSYWVDFPDIISSTDNIQVQRGLGTSTNGAGAFGGSINIKTTGYKEQAGAEFSQSVGSFNTLKSTIKLNSGLINNHFIFDARASKITSDGYIDRATSDLKSFYFSGGYVGKTTSLKAIIFSGLEKTYQAWYAVPQDSLKTNRTFNPAGMYTDANGKIKYYDNETDNYQQDYYQLHFAHQLNSNWNVNVALHETVGKGYYEEYRQGQSLLGDYGITPSQAGGFITLDSTDVVRRLWLDNNFYGVTSSLNYSDNKNVTATLGGAWNEYDGLHYNELIWAKFAGNSFIRQHYYDESATKKDFNIFGKVNVHLSSKLIGFIDLQYRQIHYYYTETKSKLGQDTLLGFFNPKGGLSYELSAGKSVYAYFGIGNKEPKRDDYVQSSSASRPKAEHMQNLEIGYTQKGRLLEFGMNGYWMNYKDQLVPTGKINDVGAYNRVNVDASYREGIEITGGIKITDHFEWSANAAFSRNKIQKFTEFVDNWDTGSQDSVIHKNTDIAFSPDRVLGTMITYKPDNHLSISLLAKHVGNQFLDNTSNYSRRIKGYTLGDLLVTYSLKPTFMKEIYVTLKVNNILDREYESNGWTYRYTYLSQSINSNNYYPQAGRNWLLGITAKF